MALIFEDLVWNDLITLIEFFLDDKKYLKIIILKISVTSVSDVDKFSVFSVFLTIYNYRIEC